MARQLLVTPENPSNSISRWFGPLKDRDDDAVAAIWDRYFEKLVRLAQSHLQSVPRREADEEDVALSAMQSLVRGVSDGRFDQLRDRSDLWKLLVTITIHKASDQRRRVNAQKRGGGDVRGESVFIGASGESNPGWEQFSDATPTPDTLVALEEQQARLFGLLRDDSLRQIARWRMEGLTIEAIAEQLDTTTRTIDRKLKLIRNKWEKELADNDT